MNFKTTFDCIATQVTRWTGSYRGFAIAFIGVLIWGVLGPVYRFSEDWQLVINTSTTIITFLMVFLIQYSQNKDTKALHIKIDELIRVNKAASDKLRGIEDKTEEEIEKIKDKYNGISK